MLLALWLLAQTIDQKSVLYGILFAVAVWLLIKVTTKVSAITTVLFFVLLWVLIQTSPVQTWLVSTAADKLSASMHTRISIRRVGFSFFNKMVLRDALIEDQNKDTLLYAGQLRLNITDWFFTKKNIELQYIGLTDATIKMQRKDSVWNYQFLADYFASPKKTDTSKGIELHLKKLQLNNIHFLKKDEWRGEDMELRLTSLLADADEIDFSKKIARLNLLEFTEPSFAISNYTGRRPFPPVDTAVIRNDPNHLRWNAAGWDITLKAGVIKNGSFQDNKMDGIKPTPYFDSHHIYFSSINWDFKNVRFYKDTVTAQMLLATKERSGITVRKLSAQIKVFPEAMEFAKLDLQTNKSRLRNFFAMRYKSFDDMSDFVTKVKMEGDFTDADVDSDDIGFFAPELKNWKKNIHVTGIITGPVADLRGKNVLIAAGKNTLLNGDIHMKGLPDIDSTLIQFRSNEFRTTYKDMVTLIPELKTITQPRLDLVEYLRFKGTFNGYIKNFVTTGTIETNLGSLVTDVNMKIPDNRPSSYSGKLNTENFDLGKFLDNDQLGSISFDGTVNGVGLKAQTLNATLDGTVHNIHYNDYTYQDIIVKGTVAKRKFNGQLISNDPNLQAQLNGLIDFSEAKPKFDFNAQVAQADFKKLNFTKDQIEFNGKLLFNFTGNTIDNFLGTARIYDGAVFKNGQRISFDSLTVESSVVENNKTITVVSNEFDAALVGEFSISELPAAFQTFLNKYYPSYIKPVKTKLANQNFSFVITTKKVDDYIDLFEKNTKGFNNTSISGRINTKENLFDLNAEVPQFSYKNISFYNVNLKGNGSLDSLSSDATIGEVYVNDSLHFPATHIQLHSASDLTDVKITTSANQTLNSANIAAQVKTLPDGVRIRFKPSTFDVNSKNWTIDKDGELVISKSLVSATNLRIYSDEQQVLVTTHPSTQGNWNDVHIDLKKINIGDFTPYFVKSDRLEGVLTGTTEIVDPFGAKQNVTFNGRAEQFRLNDDSIGKLDITGGFDRNTGLVNALVNSDNRGYQFDVNAIINIHDSATTQPVNVTLNLKEAKVELLEKYLNSVFTNISGYASGKLQIIGPGNQLKYLGKLQLRDGKMKVIYTQCTYKIPLANVNMEDGYIDFGSFEIQDTLGHKGEVTRARLNHQSFNNLAYDFAISTNKLLVLNTKLSDNNQFYGKVIGKVNFTLSGKQENMQMNITGEPTDSSTIVLPPSTNRESADADFIVWKVYGTEMKNVSDKKGTNLTMNLNITANDLATVYVVMDPLTNDVIKTNGHGNLHIKVGTTDDLTINGRYEIDKGSYNFSFQSLVRKPFTFNEDADNYIQWTGNPYDANINIEAIYRAENVRFTDLGVLDQSSLDKSSLNAKSYRGPVLVIAKLSERLTSPKIEFDIELPPNSQLKNDAYTTGLLQTIQRDQNELNKQVSFLLVLNQFAPMTNTTAFDPTTALTGAVVNSISGVISNVFNRQFSNFFQKVFRDPSIKVNFNTTLYNGSNYLDVVDPTKVNYDRTNLNLSVGKSFLNERLTFIFGSALDFGLSAQQAAASAFQFLPDFTMEYKVTPDGRFTLSLFYRDSYNYLSVANHTENRSGGSISYSKDFERLDELFKKKKKDKPKPTPPPPPPPETGSQ